MRRMINDPGKIIKCSYENVGRESKIYVPVKNIDELPIRFDLIISNLSAIAPVFAYYSDSDGATYGGGSFSIPLDGKGNISACISPESIIWPETTMPYLILTLTYDRGDIQTAPIPNNSLVLITNVIHLEKGVID